MRRGLMAWNTDELPPEILGERLVRMRQAMAANDIDALLIYTNFPRPSAVAFLTAFTPYWADAVLYVPKTGEPLFSTALSKRVAKWINSVKPVGELVCTPNPGVEVAKRIAADTGIKTVGILEMDALPTYIYDDVEAGAPGVKLVEGGRAFAQARRLIDVSERGLLAHAGTIASDALNAVDPATMRDAGAVVGAVEKAARLAGAEEAYIHIAPDLAANASFARLSGAAPLGQRFAIRASVAYKGIWVRRIRTFSTDAADAALCAKADAWLETTLLGLKPDTGLNAQFVSAAKAAGGPLESWLAESSIGSYPLEAVASSSADSVTPDNSMLVVTVKLALGGAPWVGGAPVLVSSSGNALLAQPTDAGAVSSAA